MIYYDTQYTKGNNNITVTISAYDNYNNVEVDGMYFQNYDNITPIDSIDFIINIQQGITDGSVIHSIIRNSELYKLNYEVINERNTN